MLALHAPRGEKADDPRGQRGQQKAQYAMHDLPRRRRKIDTSVARLANFPGDSRLYL
jgi:hypothetical protein